MFNRLTTFAYKTFNIQEEKLEHPIFDAINKNALGTFKDHLCPAVLKEFNHLGYTPLIACIVQNREKMVMEITDRFSQKVIDAQHLCTRSRDIKRQTALMFAAKLGHTHLLPHLLVNDSTNGRDYRDIDGNTAVHLAAQFNHFEALKILLRQDEVVIRPVENDIISKSLPMRPDLDIKNTDGKTAEMLTTDPSIEAYLRQIRLDDELKLAVSDVEPLKIKEFLEQGADATCRNRYGADPLRLLLDDYHATVAWGFSWPSYAKSIELLITADPKPDLNELRGGWTLLHYVIDREDINLVGVLLKEGADPDIACGPYNLTPLKLALGKQNPEIVKLLVEYNADLCVGEWMDDDEGFYDLLGTVLRNPFTRKKPEPTVKLQWKNDFEEETGKPQVATHSHSNTF